MIVCHSDYLSGTGKLGCDHAVPCGRCERRNIAHQCSYDAVKDEPAGTQRRREATAVHPKSEKPDQAQVFHFVGQGPGPQTSPVRRLDEPLLLSDYARPPPTSGRPKGFENSSLDVSAYSGQVGFVGSSSCSDVFDQINGSLDIPKTVNAPDPNVHAPPVPEDLVLRGAEVLFNLRDLEMVNRLLQKGLAGGEGYLLYEPIYQIWMREITEQLGPVLSKVSSPDELHGLSIKLWHNTRLPIEIDDSTSARDWAQRTTGQYLRWEVLGLICTAIGLASGGLSNRDPVFVPNQGSLKDRPTLLLMMLNLAERCIDFCKICMNHNDLYVCLLVSVYRYMLTCTIYHTRADSWELV